MTAAPIIQGEKLAFALERLWGWPTKLARKAFPNFGETHIVPPEKIPPLSSLTIWMWADPHGERNWFMNWTGVDSDGRRWTFKEWPDAHMGEWALPGNKPDGKPGPAQTAGGGKSFEDYKRIILEAEGWRTNQAGAWELGPDGFTTFDRQMDPRPAGTSVPSDMDAVTYLDLMNEPLRDSKGKVLLPGLDFRAGPGCLIKEGIGWVNDWVNEGWDANAPVTPMNMPRWFVSSACPNTIWSLRSWTGEDLEKGASKDPIDCLKGLAKTEIRHMASGALGSYGGGRGY